MKNPSANEPVPEKDFWDLGDDHLEDLEEETPSSGAISQSTEPLVEPIAPKKEAMPTLDNLPEIPSEEIQRAEAEVEAEAKPSLQAEVTEKDLSSEKNTPQTTSAQTATQDPQRTNTFEKVSLAVFVLCLLGIGAWSLSNYYSQAPEGTFVETTEDYPVAGEHCVIEEIETWWRKPIRKGENVDRGIQLNAQLIPCARIKISGNQNASIRYAFVNETGFIIGDSAILQIKNGKFDTNGSHEIIVNCSAGFSNVSLINSYVNADIDPWELQIFEAAAGATPDKASEPLIKSIVEAHFKEND